MTLILQLLVVTTLVVALNAVPVDHSESTTVGIRTLPARLDQKDHSKESNEDKSSEIKRTSRDTTGTVPRQHADQEENKSTSTTTRPLLGSASRVARDIPQYNSGSSTSRYDSSSGLGSARPYGSNSNSGSNAPYGSSSNLGSNTPYGSNSGLGSKTPYGSNPQTYSSSQSGSYQNSQQPLGQGTHGSRPERDTHTEKPGPTLTPSRLGNSQHPQGQTKDAPISRPARDSPVPPPPPEKHEHKPEKPEPKDHPKHEPHHSKEEH